MRVLRKIIGGAAVGGVAIFAGTGAFDDKTTRGEAGEIVESGGLGAFVLRLGDCVQMPDEDAAIVSSVEGVPCEQPHDAQVYSEFKLDGSSGMPGAEEMDALAFQGCTERWTAAFGGSFESDADHDVNYFFPTKESWAEDDRTVTCFVMKVDGSPLIGSKVTS